MNRRRFFKALAFIIPGIALGSRLKREPAKHFTMKDEDNHFNYTSPIKLKKSTIEEDKYEPVAVEYKVEKANRNWVQLNDVGGIREKFVLFDVVDGKLIYVKKIDPKKRRIYYFEGYTNQPPLKKHDILITKYKPFKFKEFA